MSSCKIGELQCDGLVSDRAGLEDKGGVVDSQLRVYGVSNLRICDASIFPDCVSGHPVSQTKLIQSLTDCSKRQW